MKQKFTLVLIIAAFSFFKINTANAQVNVQDSLALVDLYNSTNGSGWYDHTNWLTSAPLTAWHLVLIESNRVTELFLARNNLNGAISPSLGNLTNLRELELNNNHLSGSIPSSFGSLKNLNFLFLSTNQLSGAIPSSLGKLVNINILNLYQNQLSNTIPESFSKLTNLSLLYLGANQLTGIVPSFFKNLKKLKNLDLSKNHLVGNISFISKLKNLSYLNLSYNQFTGSITYLENLSNITNIDLSNNNFSGKIPVFRKPDTTSYYYNNFNLSYNQLTGNISNQFDSLENFLNLLNLSHNQLSGSFPLSFGNLSNLTNLDLSSNQFTDTIPSSFTKLGLSKLNLDSNHFTFASIQKVAGAFPFTVYSPQATIHLNQIGNKLAVSVGGTLSNNTYKWYKDGVLYKTRKGDSSLSVNSSGLYYVDVINSIATALTLHSDTINYTMFTSLSGKQVNNQNKILKAQVYPNPAITNPTLSFYADGKYSLTVTDASGKILQIRKGIAEKRMNHIQLDLSKYARGMYFIIIKDEQNEKQIINLEKR